MLLLPADLTQQFSALLDRKGFAGQNKAACLKWLRFYWDFCAKYHHDPYRPESLPPFLAKLQEKRQSEQQRKQARYAIALFYRLQAEPDAFARAAPAAETLPAVSRKQPTHEESDSPAQTVRESSATYAVNPLPQKQQGAASSPRDDKAGNGAAVRTGSSWVFVFDTLHSEIKIKNSAKSRVLPARNAGLTFPWCCRGQKSS